MVKLGKKPNNSYSSDSNTQFNKFRKNHILVPLLKAGLTLQFMETQEIGPANSGTTFDGYSDPECQIGCLEAVQMRAICISFLRFRWTRKSFSLLISELSPPVKVRKIGNWNDPFLSCISVGRNYSNYESTISAYDTM